jgi:hypothetical protein
MPIAMKWTTGLIGLGALYLVLAPQSHITQAFGAGQRFISGTLHTAVTGKA